MSDLPLFKTTADVEIRDLKERLSNANEQLEILGLQSKKKSERIAELELWIEYAVKHDLQMPEWIRNSASCLLNNSTKKGGDV
jgi:hypothetical protein